VLRFLSGTGKSGEFHVSGTNGDGRLWFTDGRVSGFQAARAAEPHEAIFQMLRISDGDFDFTADRPRPDDAHAVDAVDLDSTIEAAEHRMAEWMRIVEVVPSLSHGLNLRAEAPEGRIELEPGQWMTIVTVARGGTVGQVIDERGMQEFDGCAAVRDLVAAGLVEVSVPVGGTAVEAEPVFEGTVLLGAEPIEPVADVAAPAEEPVADFSAESTFSFGTGYQFDATPQTAETAEPDPDENLVPGQLLRFGYEPESSAPGAVWVEAQGAEQPAAEPVEAWDSTTAEPVQSWESQEGEGSDHYAALRAAMVEVGENLSAEGEVEDGGDESPVYELHTEPEMDGRAALSALLSEVTTPEQTAEAGPQDDALADRGPWTEHELSAMEADRDAEEPSNIVPFAPAHDPSASEEGPTAASDDEEAGESSPAEEPINRGLLLKFLSSVRN
jgi:hypothetical protein